MTHRVEAVQPAIVDSVRRYGEHLANGIKFTLIDNRVMSPPLTPNVVEEQFNNRRGFILCRDEPGFERVNSLDGEAVHIDSLSGVQLTPATPDEPDAGADLEPATQDGDLGTLDEGGDGAEPEATGEPTEPTGDTATAGDAAAPAGDATDATDAANDDDNEDEGADGNAADGPYAGYTKAQLMAELDQRGIEYNRRANRPDLVALLQAAE